MTTRSPFGGLRGEHKIHVLVNYETTWYASNKAAYDEVHENRIGEVRRVVVHDGHQGPKEIGVPPEFLKLAHRSCTERRRRAL